jgi:chromosome partitioning protein
MPVILACVNLKGGVGKTAIAVNFAAYCGRQGMRTLLVDCDPQTNATFSCLRAEDWVDHATHYGTIASLLGVRSVAGATNLNDAKTVIKRDVFENVDLVPSHISLFSVDLALGGAAGRELKLRKALKPVLDDYENLDHKITNAGIIVSRVGRKATHRENLMASLRMKFEDLVLQSELRERVAVPESVSLQKTVFDMGDEQASQEFTAMSQELLARISASN